ncbi:AbrB/MazE/SpoVT family DNA-binding domain-containing protein [Nostoc sp.]|uniref:AbrB/MazE/SpoVT family DNA-binding domain-containing protein n=1 Tax=Nostoc sp. TaxID=1180 RepID=UPI002FF54F96
MKIRKTAIIAKVTADGKLEIPPEVLAQLQPSTEYEVSVTEDKIVLKKISKLNVDLDEFLQGLENL